MKRHLLPGRSGQVCVSLTHQGRQVGHQVLPGGDQDLAGVAEALVPHIEGGQHLGRGPPSGLSEQRGALAQDPLGLLGRPGAFGIEHRQRVVEQGTATPGAARDDGQVLGREDRAGHGPRQVPAGANRLTVHLGPSPPASENLRFHLHGGSGTLEPGPHDGRLHTGLDQGLGRGAPKRSAAAQEGQGLEHAGLARPVGAGDDRRPLGLGLKGGVGEDPEARQLQVTHAHRGQGLLTAIPCQETPLAQSAFRRRGRA